MVKLCEDVRPMELMLERLGIDLNRAWPEYENELCRAARNCLGCKFFANCGRDVDQYIDLCPNAALLKRLPRRPNFQKLERAA